MGLNRSLDLVMFGAAGWSASDHLDTANPGGEDGSTAVWGTALCIKPVNVGLTILAGRQPWDLRTSAGNVLQLVCGALTLTGVALTAGKWNHVGFQYDGANARLYQGGVQTASAAAVYVPGAAAAMTLGRRVDGFPVNVNTRIAGLVQWRGAATAGDFLDHFNASRQQYSVAAMSGGAVTNTHRYSVRRARGAAFTGLQDLVGSDHMTITGALSLLGDQIPAWA